MKLADRYIFHQAHDDSKNYEVKCTRCGCTAHVCKSIGGLVVKYDTKELEKELSNGKSVNYICPNCHTKHVTDKINKIRFYSIRLKIKTFMAYISRLMK